MSQTKRIGLDRRIDLEWLDTVAAQVAAGGDVATIRARLFDLLDGKLSGGHKVGTACYKAVRLLSRTWVNVNPNVVGLRNRAVELLPSLSPRERIALHWSLLTAGYSFFGALTEHTGRLLSLQQSLSLSQLTRRLQETWGDRSTMTRATRRAVRSMVQWGVLADTKDRGVYSQGAKPIAVGNELAELLLEGLLLHQAKAIPVDQATRHPALFPFDIRLRAHDLRQSPRFEVHRQGLDVDIVRLVEPTTAERELWRNRSISGKYRGR